jgi:hypothetical protein
MWIERPFAEVQKKRPVSSRADHQQTCPLCDLAEAELGESGTNHLQTNDSDFVNIR